MPIDYILYSDLTLHYASVTQVYIITFVCWRFDRYYSFSSVRRCFVKFFTGSDYNIPYYD